MPDELTKHRPSLGALTGIRFFAAVAVVVFHTHVSQEVYRNGHHALAYFVANGYLAVSLFFMLSGFILAYTYEGQIRGKGDRRRFWEARFARVWPMYAVSLFANSVPYFTFPAPGTALATLLMVQAWNPANLEMAAAWNFVCWTLSCEAFFYLCFPFVQTWADYRSPRALKWGVGLALLVTALCNTGPVTLHAPAPAVFRHIPFPIVHLPEFLIGVGLGNLFLRRSRTTSPGWRTYAGLAITTTIMCLPIGLWTSLAILGLAALVYGLAAERTLLSRMLGTRALLLGGGISYSMYLMQTPVRYWVLRGTERFEIRSPEVHLTLTIAILLLTSYATFRGIEEPARKRFRTLFAHIERRNRLQILQSN